MYKVQEGGAFSHDCPVDWRLIQVQQEEEPSMNDGERIELENLYAIQLNTMRAEARNRSGINRQPGSCWECGALDHYSPNCPKKRDRPEQFNPCYNCREEGHRASDCPKPVQVRIKPRYTPDIPRD